MAAAAPAFQSSPGNIIVITGSALSSGPHGIKEEHPDEIPETAGNRLAAAFEFIRRDNIPCHDIKIGDFLRRAGVYCVSNRIIPD
jgi:hypothetical protein